VTARTVVRVTRFRDVFAKTKHPAPETLGTIATWIKNIDVASKSRLPMMILGTVGDTRSENDCYRFNENVTAISGAIVEHDDGRISFATAVRFLREVDVGGIVYTSPSHTPEDPRWRIVCPASTELPPEAHRLLVDRLGVIFAYGPHDARETFLAPESWTLSQSYYYGHVRGRPPIEVAVVEGRFIDEVTEYDPYIPKRRPERTEDDEPREVDPTDAVRVRAALTALDADCDRGTWIKYGMALKADFGPFGWSIWHDWSATAAEKYPGETKVRRVWATLKPRDIHVNTIFYDAYAAGWEEELLDWNSDDGIEAYEPPEDAV
jgi:hypothetical protein